MNILKKKNIFSEFTENSKNSELTRKNFGRRIIDLFIHKPIRINDKNLKNIIETQDINKQITMDLKIIDHIKPYNKKSPYKIICEDNTKKKINILFFRYFPYLINKFIINQKYRITGKLQFFSNTYQIIHPTDVVSQDILDSFEILEPEYNLSRTKINKKHFRKIILKYFKLFENFNFPNEWIKKEILKRNSWFSFKESVTRLHKPKDITKENEYKPYIKRLAFDELLSNFLIFNLLKKKQKSISEIKVKDFNLSKKIIHKLNFELTKDQRKTFIEIKKDFQEKKMYRLIQGDVGSGKTIVSLLSIADMIMSGYQCVLMAPTEILVKQHFEYFQNYLSPYGIKIVYLTSKVKNKETIIKKISNKDIDLVIGTHSVYNKSIKFSKLGLVVIDEQHKFGVNQRIKLIKKSLSSHVLIMSATPIPRSLSFAYYGEIDISLIKSKPKGRKKVVTSILSTKRMEQLIKGIKRKIDKNEQVFWILPNIGDLNTDEEKESVLTRYKFLKKFFKNKVGMVHGRMANDEINDNMDQFKKKKRMILVSTTVIEVGVNIPSATLIIIEEANKFGLAQLHQLRGRIARSNLESNCVLIHNHNLSENSRKRLLILKNSNDGFEIAEKDMFLRGAGDFFGTNQSGIPNWKFFEPYEDIEMLDDVKNNCKDLLKDQMFNKPKINFLINTFYGEKEFLNFYSA